MAARTRKRAPESVIHADTGWMLAEIDRLAREHEALRAQHGAAVKAAGLREWERATHRSNRSYESGVVEGLMMVRGLLTRWDGGAR